jgi:hypothetical protein
MELASRLGSVLSALLVISAGLTAHAAPGDTRVPATSHVEFRPSALWDGRKETDFHAIDFPRMVPAHSAPFMNDEEYVLGVSQNGESKAYPTRFAAWHHVVNDRIGKAESGGAKYVTVTYCIVCNSGMCFETPVVNGKPLQLDFFGLYNGVMTMFDHQTSSVWLQVSSTCVRGPLKGTALKPRTVLDTTWGEWKKLHPDTLVMAPERRFHDCYEPNGTVVERGYDSFPGDYFRKTMTRMDHRLPSFDLVLALSLSPAEAGVLSDTPAITEASKGTQYRAYPVKTFHDRSAVVNDRVGSTPVSVFFLADTQTCSAVCPVVDGRQLTLVCHGIDDKARFYDRETGTRWSLEGKGMAGPLAGKQMPRLNCHMSEWYGWSAYFPQTTIWGMKTPPETAKTWLTTAQAVTPAPVR